MKRFLIISILVSVFMMIYSAISFCENYAYVREWGGAGIGNGQYLWTYKYNI